MGAMMIALSRLALLVKSNTKSILGFYAEMSIWVIWNELWRS